MIALFLLSLVTAAPHPPQAAQAGEPIVCEFRVFDGGEDVTRETRVRVYASGTKEHGIATDAAGIARLRPGLYDVQMLRERGGQVTGIRWMTSLLVQRYPDEGGRHLEVANFKPQYGALELRTTNAAAQEATAFTTGDRSRPLANAIRGDGYLLLVVPAGRYDVRVKGTSPDAPATWLTDVDVPADRTRLRTVGTGR